METCKKCKREAVSLVVLEQRSCSNCGYTFNTAINADVRRWATNWKKAATEYRKLANRHVDILATAMEKLLALDTRCNELQMELETMEEAYHDAAGERDELLAELGRT